MYFRYEVFVRTSETEEEERRTDPNSFDDEDSAIGTSTQEEILAELMTDLDAAGKIFGEAWQLVDRRKRKQVSFFVSGIDNDFVYSELMQHGFGARGSQTVVFISKKELSEGAISSEVEQSKEQQLKKNLVEAMKMTTGSLTVRQVLNNIKKKAELTEGCIVQLISASLLATLGLGMNNLIYVVVSMFLAPFMNAMNLFIFAFRVKDRQGMKNAVGLFLLFVGVIMSTGFFVGFPIQYYTWIHNKHREHRFKSYPTYEMFKRSEIHNILIGIFVSAVSGLSTYTGIVAPRNRFVHVGNAISRSLVAPVSNAGMMLSASVVASVSLVLQSSDSPCRRAWTMCGTNMTADDASFADAMSECERGLWMRTMLSAVSSSPQKPPVICRLALEFVIRAVRAFLVMTVNVVMLVLVGSFMLWVQKFQLLNLQPKHLRSFHKYDIDYYRKTMAHKQPHSTEEYVATLRNQTCQKTAVCLPDVDVMMQAAQKSVHYQTICSINGMGLLPVPLNDIPDDLSMSIGFSPETSPSFHSLRRRPRSRLLSDNQRTIRDTILSEDFDSQPVAETCLNKVDSVSGEESFVFLDSPPPIRRKDSQTIGRFQVTLA